MATIDKEITGYAGGKEGRMSGLATFFIIIGIIGLIACFILAGFVTKTSKSSSWGENGLSPIWIALGIVCLIQGIALSIVLSAGAEVIRLLKKQNGLEYGGKISKPYPKFGHKRYEVR
ncbi:hypothetical protein ISS37_07560 [candidate division KSB1 bacterium]|nr:hypothetical protein [candidate division KSB1 bacterium]